MNNADGDSKDGRGNDVAELYLANDDLLACIRRVVAASEDEDVAALRSALHDLQGETERRFALEETLMRECRYAAAEAHRIEHQRLLGEIQHQIDDLDGNKLTVAYIGRFVQNWVLQHVVSKDSQFVNAIFTHDGTTDRRRETGELADGEHEVREFEERRLENLEPIRWTANMEIGCRSIDTDHRSIITLLNAIIDANQAADRPRLGELLAQLGDETVAHFRDEEQWMSEIGYQLIDEHKAEHRRLLDEYANQVDEFHKDNISAEFLGRFIYRWFVRHIEGFDATLKPA